MYSNRWDWGWFACNQKGRDPKVDRDGHKESSHLPDPSDTPAQTECAQTFTQQRHNTADDLFPSF